jgi:3-methyladenine DNA glycosylase AlkD
MSENGGRLVARHDRPPRPEAIPMTPKEALAKLESLGDEKVRSYNIRNGAGKNQFGVKLGDIRKLAAKIKSDHALALALWKSGNLDARLLAILVVDPKKLSTEELDRMVRSADVAQLAEWLLNYVVKNHPEKEALRQEWMAGKAEDDPWAARAGWGLTAERIGKSPDGLDVPKLLDRIEKEMKDAPAPSQWTMNNSLAGIGIRFPEQRERALAIGEKLGVFRDYPVSKGCTSPFAPIWIAEMVRRQG